MRNAYAGKCYRCGQKVRAQKGHFEKSSAVHACKWGVKIQYLGKWLIQHTECAIEWRGTDRHFIYNPIQKQTTNTKEATRSVEERLDDTESAKLTCPHT